MGIIYTITLLAILVVFMLVKKSDNKLNGVGAFGLGMVLILCYNVLECYILNFAKIKLTLLNLSIVNFIVLVPAIIYLLKSKKIQKYYVNNNDVMSITIIGICVLLFAIMQYGTSINVKYQSTDAITHYRAAQDFADSEHLLNMEPDELWGFQNWKLASYVNSALIMKIFSNVMDNFYFYKIFVVFGVFVLFLIGYMMYMACTKISKGKAPVLSVITSLLFMLGYPLNSLLFGFEYMSMGILVITALVYAVVLFTEKELKISTILGILFLLNFQLFNAYYQFIPYVYSALFIYICWVNYKEDKKLFTKKNIVTLLVTLILPFALGFLYYMAQGIYNLGSIVSGVESSIKTQQGLLSSFKIEGYAYNDLYSGIIILLPLLVYVIIKDIKTKKTIDFSSIGAIFCLGYITLLFAGNILGYVSDYYVTKNYFALMIFLWFVNFKGLYYLSENKKVVPYILVGVYTVSIVISFLNYNADNVENKLKVPTFKSFTGVYNSNSLALIYSYNTFYDEEMQIMKYAKDNLDKSKKIEMLGSEHQTFWAYPMLDYYYYYDEMDKWWFQNKIRFKCYNNEIAKNADYLICFYGSRFYQKYDKTLLENKEIIYENSMGKIIKNN